MTQRINEAVSVNFVYNSQTQELSPRFIKWKEKLYQVSKVGLHHKFKRGNTLFHVFSVASKNVFLRLILNTDTLHWNLEEIGDSLIS